jgi:hypothetical protein
MTSAWHEQHGPRQRHGFAADTPLDKGFNVSELKVWPVSGAIELTVWAKPRASKSRVLGLRGGQLEVAIAAPPVDGAANDELVRTLASHFGIARSNVVLVAGQAGRTKRVRISGIEPALLLARIPR